MRYMVLTITVAAIGINGSLDHANAADVGRPPEVEYRPRPAPLTVRLPSWCNPEWQCGTSGCGWRQFCSRQVFPSPYQWQAQAIARYDDDWCRYYGPRGSPVYVQCRENLYYERASLPLRATMKGADFVWDEEKLERFIANPDQMVPGNSMKPYGGLASAYSRAKVVAFLQSLTTGQ